MQGENQEEGKSGKKLPWKKNLQEGEGEPPGLRAKRMWPRGLLIGSRTAKIEHRY